MRKSTENTHTFPIFALLGMGLLGMSTACEFADNTDSESGGQESPIDAGGDECIDTGQCVGEGGQVWLEHIEYAPSLVQDGQPAAQIRLLAFFFREPVAINPGGTACFDLISDPRSPFGLFDPREYADVGPVVVTGGGMSFRLETRRDAMDYLHHSTHEVFYELVEPEADEQSLIAGENYSISFGGTEDTPPVEAIEFAQLPERLAPAGPELDDLVIRRDEPVDVPFGSDDAAYYPHVALMRSDGEVIVLCSGSQGAPDVLVSPEAVAAFLGHEPAAEGILWRVASRPAILNAGAVSAASVWANWSTIQKFTIID